jgi:hypothetical protein
MGLFGSVRVDILDPYVTELTRPTLLNYYYIIIIIIIIIHVIFF